MISVKTSKCQSSGILVKAIFKFFGDDRSCSSRKANLSQILSQDSRLFSTHKLIDSKTSLTLSAEQKDISKQFTVNQHLKVHRSAIDLTVCENPQELSALNPDYRTSTSQDKKWFTKPGKTNIAVANTSNPVERNETPVWRHSIQRKSELETDIKKIEVLSGSLHCDSNNDYLYHQRTDNQNHSLEIIEKSLRKKLLDRPATMVYDHMAPTPSHLLKISLQSDLPFMKSCIDLELRIKGKFLLPPGHHLVYFHQQVPTSNLQPDGTDNLHSPGFPFERRLWVGGSISFNRPLTLFPKIQMLCSERITDVKVTGIPGDEKVFVETTRQIINPYLYRVEIKEVRTLVFMRRKKYVKVPERKCALRPKTKPYFSITIRPTRTLLFRFSALTFNAHRIHIDSTYCRQVEGLKSMIVQGPLTVILMLAVLSEKLNKRARINSFSYRNIAPLYVEEDMTISIERGPKNEGISNWRVWIVGPSGGYAARGTATISWIGEKLSSKAYSGDIEEDS